MCFSLELKGEEIPELKIAKKDIKVYKILCGDNTPLHYHLKIDRKKVAYERGFIYYETKPFKGKSVLFNCLNVQGNAFHSYKKRSAKDEFTFYGSKTDHIVKMFIPKGALYYKNDWGAYVSSEIYFPGEEYKKKK